ncbi:MAG: hypothetical protein ABSA69_10265, partial [Verrucomicrobiota bacterium]
MPEPGSQNGQAALMFADGNQRHVNRRQSASDRAYPGSLTNDFDDLNRKKQRAGAVLPPARHG